MSIWKKPLGVMCAAVVLSLPAMANDDVIKNSNDPNNWAQQAGDYANTRYSKLDQINTQNVGSLKTAWTFSTGVLRGHEGSPLVIGNIMYIHGPFPNPVYALDLDNDQKILWKYEPKQDPTTISVMCCDTVNRGVAYADGKIFLNQADTTLVALDAKTGRGSLEGRERRSQEGRDWHKRSARHQGQGDCGSFRRRIWNTRAHHRLQRG